MTKSELIEEVRKRTTGLTGVQTNIIVDAFFKGIMDALKNGEKVEIRGFGNFRLKKRDAYKARNPKTGKQVDVPSKKVVHFKMGKELKDILSKK